MFLISTIDLRMENFKHPIDTWINALERYDFVQLCTRPSANSWSLGQVYMHLLDDSRYYLEQIKICVSSNDHSNEEPSSFAKDMLRNNEFPDDIIVGASSNELVPQPMSKEQLLSNLAALKKDIANAALLIQETSFQGRTKHPGLQYFNAAEWYQFIGMHFRHHLRQRERINEFLERAHIM
jgi:hypothetical protein